MKGSGGGAVGVIVRGGGIVKAIRPGGRDTAVLVLKDPCCNCCCALLSIEEIPNCAAAAVVVAAAVAVVVDIDDVATGTPQDAEVSPGNKEREGGLSISHALFIAAEKNAAAAWASTEVNEDVLMVVVVVEGVLPYPPRARRAGGGRGGAGPGAAAGRHRRGRGEAGGNGG